MTRPTCSTAGRVCGASSEALSDLYQCRNSNMYGRAYEAEQWHRAPAQLRIRRRQWSGVGMLGLSERAETYEHGVMGTVHASSSDLGHASRKIRTRHRRTFSCSLLLCHLAEKQAKKSHNLRRNRVQSSSEEDTTFLALDELPAGPPKQVTRFDRLSRQDCIRPRGCPGPCWQYDCGVIERQDEHELDKLTSPVYTVIILVIAPLRTQRENETVSTNPLGRG